jgi:hypothetical protein
MILFPRGYIHLVLFTVVIHAFYSHWLNLGAALLLQGAVLFGVSYEVTRPT